MSELVVGAAEVVAATEVVEGPAAGAEVEGDRFEVGRDISGWNQRSDGYSVTKTLNALHRVQDVSLVDDDDGRTNRWQIGRAHV